MAGFIQTRRPDGSAGPSYDRDLMNQSWAKNQTIKDQFGGWDKYSAAGAPTVNGWQKNLGLGPGGRSNPGMPGSGGYGGVSPVNPQAGQANELDAFKRYEDAAFGNAMNRLNPIQSQEDQTFDQRMANQGIPVGSEAYNKAKTQMDLSQSDAVSNAAFNAMGFGADLQNQSFQQDATRSQLANALMQAQMQKDVGMANVNLGYKGLAQDNSQFGRSLDQNASQFGQNLAQQNYQFNSGQDYDYWNAGNQYGLQNRALDSNDYFNTWDRNTNQNQWNDSLFMQMLGLQAPGVAQVDPSSAYNTQIGSMTNQRANNMGFLSGLFGF